MQSVLVLGLQVAENAEKPFHLLHVKESSLVWVVFLSSMQFQTVAKVFKPCVRVAQDWGVILGVEQNWMQHDFEVPLVRFRMVDFVEASRDVGRVGQLVCQILLHGKGTREQGGHGGGACKEVVPVVICFLFSRVAGCRGVPRVTILVLSAPQVHCVAGVFPRMLAHHLFSGGRIVAVGTAWLA